MNIKCTWIFLKYFFSFLYHGRCYMSLTCKLVLKSFSSAFGACHVYSHSEISDHRTKFYPGFFFSSCSKAVFNKAVPQICKKYHYKPVISSESRQLMASVRGPNSFSVRDLREEPWQVSVFTWRMSAGDGALPVGPFICLTNKKPLASSIIASKLQQAGVQRGRWV